MGLQSAVSAAEFTPDEAAVWQLEEAEWRDVPAGDVDAPLMLRRADFVGWPCCAAEPSDTSRIGDRAKDIRNKA